MLKDDIAVFPQGKEVKSVLIMLHGYGANGDDLISMASQIQEQNSYMAFYAPNAPFQMEYNAYKWFDIGDLDNESIYEQFSYIEKLIKRAMPEISVVNSFIDKIKLKHNLTDKDIALMGFSQGGLLALMTGLMHAEKLNCLIGCSAVPLSINDTFDLSHILSKPDTLLTHGTDDDVIPLIGMEITENTLKNVNIHTETHIVPGMGHNIDMSSILAMSQFLKEHSNIK